MIHLCGVTGGRCGLDHTLLVLLQGQRGRVGPPPLYAPATPPRPIPYLISPAVASY